MDKVKKVFEEILPSDCKCGSISSLTSKEELSAKRLLTGLHSHNVSISCFTSNDSFRWSYPKLELPINEKGKSEQTAKPRSAISSSRNNAVPIRRDPIRIKRLAPPNFMKLSRNTNKRLLDSRISTASKHKRNLSSI